MFCMIIHRKESMKTIDNIFDRMDRWRHLPSYQLERRADLYFALYLSEVLKRYLGISIKADIIPEFPIRIATISDGADGDKSYKADYLALSENSRTAILVELKTEMHSLNDKQKEYLMAARDVPFCMLLEGIKQIFRATTLKRKYYYLLEHLENLGQLTIPQKMKSIIARPVLQGIAKETDNIEITKREIETIIVFIQPDLDPKKENPGKTITFEQFRSVVEEYTDPISQRFACSLKEWVDVKAGCKIM